MKVRYVIVGLVLLSLAIKINPALTHDFHVNFDSIYHTRIGQIVAQTGWVPPWDPVAGGRPHLYPPMYHLLLGYSSIISGIPVFEIIQYILPLISALLIIPTFYLIRKYRDEETALWGAAFMGFSPIVTSQSFDSPHLFGLLLMPLLIYFFLKGRYFEGGGLLAICILFNYGVAIIIGATLLVYSLIRLRRGDKLPLLYTGLILAMGLGLVSPWLLVSASQMGECVDLSTAVVSINEAATGYLWTMAPFIAVIGAGLLYLVRKKNDDYIIVWKVAFAMATMGFMLSLFLPELHPYDQILLFGFSMPFLLAELKLRKEFKLAIVCVMVIGTISSVMSVVDPLSKGDLATVGWVRENVQQGTILANLEVSGTINMYMMSESVETVFDQFLECIPDRDRWVAMHEALMTSDVESSKEALERYGVDYVIVGERDSDHYGFNISKFADMGFEVVFSSGGTTIYRTR